MLPAWLTGALSGGVGAFVAAWAGAQLGFRRTKKERAFDRRVAWYEEAIQSLALYEEELDRLHKHSRHATIFAPILARRTQGSPPEVSDASPLSIPETFRPPQEVWSAVVAAEARARNALRLAEAYTDGKLRIECSVALSNSVNLVAGQLLDMGPNPEIRWVEIQSKAFAAGRVKRLLQETLRVSLELDGFLATILGPRYSRWRLLRELNKIKAEVAPAP